jgi:hypothetical protein
MKHIDFNKIVDREKEEKEFIEILHTNQKKCIYLYGKLGVGKTCFVKNILNKLNYEIIELNAIDIKNNSLNNICYSSNNQNILNLFHKKKQNNIILIDSIEFAYNNDKNIITQLIKILKNKKKINCSILFIGTFLYNDKKFIDIIKNCHIIHLKSIPKQNIIQLLQTFMPTLSFDLYEPIYNYTNDNLFKINHIFHFYNNKQTISLDLLNNFYKNKTKNENTKLTTKDLLLNYSPLHKHNFLVYETDRTIVSLLWHENIIELFKPNKTNYLLYYKDILQNICYGDYLDRVTFQKQIWIFNEMSFLIKTIYNNYKLHKLFSVHINPSCLEEIRFTKVLTKYSTEYNNYLFVQNLCLILNMDKKDLFSYFIYLKKIFENENDIYNLLNDYEISKLDIQRIYKYLVIH